MRHGVLVCVLSALVLSCGAHRGQVASVPQTNAVARFVDVLSNRRPLYGLGADCGEWQVTPDSRDADVPPTTEEVSGRDSDLDDAGEPASEPEEDEENETPARPDVGSTGVRGSLRARAPDDQGRMYGFSYAVTLHPTVRMTIEGRGSWSPAPGVTIESSEPGWAVIGSASMCLLEVDVREDQAFTSTRCTIGLNPPTKPRGEPQFS